MGPGGAAADNMRNIVFIFIDSLRADHLGCYGYQRPTSPYLDSLATRSLVLDACYSASNFTAPAFTSVFTATYPSRHGIFDFFSQAQRSAVKAALDAAGVRTGGVVTFRFFKNLLGRIWGDLEAVTDTLSFDYSKDLPRAVSDAAVSWLERHGKAGPFCLFLHYDGPHVPYRLPDEYAEFFDPSDPLPAEPEIRSTFFPQHLERIEDSSGQGRSIPRIFKLIADINYRRRRLSPATRQWLVDKYDASVRYNDDMLARIDDALRALDLADDTILAVFSDHGEELLDHGHFGHGGVHLYEEIIRTVGIIHDPARPQPERLALPVSHVQILPTLLARAGVPLVSRGLKDLDLVTSRREQEAGKPPAPVFCIGEFKTAVRLGKLKWIHSLPSRHFPWHRRLRLWLRLLQIRERRDELYNLASDPQERTNLSARRELCRPLAALLAQHLQDSPGRGEPGAPGKALTASERERIEKELRDLGYM